MSFSEDIEPPYILASLPHPVDSVHGRILASGVLRLQGLKKRKRFEAAVSIDGEGINIYNIQNPRLVASYSVPPHAYFTIPPSSVFQKATKDQPARRYTYASIVHSQSLKSNAQILCFREDIHPPALGDAEKFTYDIAAQPSEVAAIETVGANSASDGSAHNVIVVYKNGTIECLSSDLQTCKWTSSLANLLHSGGEKSNQGKIGIEYVSITTGDIARKTFLKDRDDILGKLDPLLKSKTSQLATIPVLCLVSEPKEDELAAGHTKQFHLLALRALSPSTITSHHSEVRHLVAWPLLVPSETPSRLDGASQYSLHSATGTLQQLSPEAIICYDLTHTSPEVSVFRPQEGSFKSFTRLSSTLSLALSSSLLGIYDVRYSALQGALSFQPINDTHKEAKKRKRGSFFERSEQLSLTLYLSEIGLVIGLAGNDLVGIQLSDNFYSKKNQRRTGLLINSISKGVASYESTLKEYLAPASLKPFSQLVDSLPALEGDWKEKVSLLDEFATNKDVFNFERLFAEALGVKRDTAAFDAWVESQGKTSNAANEASKETEPLPSWQFSSEITEPQRLINRHKAMYALSKIFGWTSTAETSATSSKTATSITIKFLPPNVFQWLLQSRFLSRDVIEGSLHQTSSVSEQTRSVNEGDIVTSIFNYDNKMRLLYFILNSKAYLDIHEVAQAIKLIIQSLDTTPLSQLTSHPLSNGDSEETAKDMEVYLDQAVEAATDAIDQAFETLEHGVLLRSQTLQPALTKLHSFPPPRIVETLRARLSHQELVFLIQLLRIELTEGGWASRYFVDADPDHVSESEDPSDRAIGIIATLLSCVLDAIGVNGWLASASSSKPGEEAPDDLIHLLRQEISAALEGVHEATFMKGLLGEYLRFSYRDANTVKVPDHVRNLLLEKPFLVPKQDSEYDALQKRIVPLGLRPVDAAQAKWKKDIGGQWKLKSRREIGQAISRQVPKYSIEKIRI